MKKTQKIIITAGVLFALVAVMFQKTVDFVKKGIADSQKIRVVESNSCTGNQQDTPNFPGCNSIF